MKKIWLFILGLCTVLFSGNFTQAKDYEYTNLDITANILIDGTIDVKEDFTANFFVSKHGIIRDIPLNYSVGGKDFHIEISNINVQGKNFTTSKNNGNIEIKIGDANRTVIGEQIYPISYSTYGLIKNFSGMGYAELYWNLVGYDFDTNVNKIRAEIILPKTYTGFTTDDFLITTDGKSKTIDGFDGTVDWSNGDRIIITYDKKLPAFHGITLAVKFPNNYFQFDHKKQANLIGHIGFNILYKIKDNLLYFVLSFAFLLILSIFAFYYKKRSQKDLIVVQYNPPEGLDSAEVGLLFYHKSDPISIISLIYKRLLAGLITIDNQSSQSSMGNQKIPDSYVIHKIKEPSEMTPSYELLFWKSFFDLGDTVEISKKSNLFLDDSLKSLEDRGYKKGWFKKDDSINKRNLFIIFIIITLIILLFATPHNEQKDKIMTTTILILCIILVIFPKIGILVGVDIPKFKRMKTTEKGDSLIYHILGFKKFLETCDTNILKTFLKKDSLYFDKILPYAIIFGIESKLIKKVQPLVSELGLTLYILQFENLFYNILHDIAENSTPIEKWTSPSLGNNGDNSYDSDSGFSSGSSFSGGGSSFSSGGGGGGGGGRSW